MSGMSETADLNCVVEGIEFVAKSNQIVRNFWSSRDDSQYRERLVEIRDAWTNCKSNKDSET